MKRLSETPLKAITSGVWGPRVGVEDENGRQNGQGGPERAPGGLEQQHDEHEAEDRVPRERRALAIGQPFVVQHDVERRDRRRGRQQEIEPGDSPPPGKKPERALQPRSFEHRTAQVDQRDGERQVDGPHIDRLEQDHPGQQKLEAGPGKCHARDDPALPALGAAHPDLGLLDDPLRFGGAVDFIRHRPSPRISGLLARHIPPRTAAVGRSCPRPSCCCREACTPGNEPVHVGPQTYRRPHPAPFPEAVPELRVSRSRARCGRAQEPPGPPQRDPRLPRRSKTRAAGRYPATS